MALISGWGHEKDLHNECFLWKEIAGAGGFRENQNICRVLFLQCSPVLYFIKPFSSQKLVSSPVLE